MTEEEKQNSKAGETPAVEADRSTHIKKPAIQVLDDWCKGCEICIIRCPVEALEKSKNLNKKGVYPPVHNEEVECTRCRLCELLCPDFAITVLAKEDDRSEEEPKKKLIIGGIVNEV